MEPSAETTAHFLLNVMTTFPFLRSAGTKNPIHAIGFVIETGLSGFLQLHNPDNISHFPEKRNPKSGIRLQKISIFAELFPSGTNGSG